KPKITNGATSPLGETWRLVIRIRIWDIENS
ncbi:MAG: hypothetical protein ACI814_003321, partial [Mariniblastus sp.]